VVEISHSAFWASVERAAKEVATWPQWKRAGVVAVFKTKRPKKVRKLKKTKKTKRA